MFRSLAMLCALFSLLLFVPATLSAQDEDVNGPKIDAEKDYYAILETGKGDIVLRLFPDESPITVRNFVNLIEGTKPFKDPKSGQTVKRPYYDGIVFHRIIPGFMIQGGDPLGNGQGGPGFKFKNERTEKYSFAKDAYLLAMANAGPNTNGSQFFITDKGSNPGFLDGGYTIFGQAVDGRDAVDAIARGKRGGPRGDTALEPVAIKKARVVRVAKGSDPATKPWNAKQEAAAAPAKAAAPAVQVHVPAPEPSIVETKEAPAVKEKIEYSPASQAEAEAAQSTAS